MCFKSYLMTWVQIAASCKSPPLIMCMVLEHLFIKFVECENEWTDWLKIAGPLLDQRGVINPQPGTFCPVNSFILAYVNLCTGNSKYKLRLIRCVSKHDICASINYEPNAKEMPRHVSIFKYIKLSKKKQQAGLISKPGFIKSFGWTPPPSPQPKGLRFSFTNINLSQTIMWYTVCLPWRLTEHTIRNIE